MQTYKLAKSLLHISSDQENLAKDLAESFVKKCRAAVADHNSFSVSLSGGSTPKALYALLAKPLFSNQIPWQKVYFFWGDERCVARTKDESNYRMVNEVLLSKIPVPSQNIFAFQDQDKDPNIAASMYEDAIKEFFALGSGDFPCFDLVFLGLGPEGHCASIFPGSAALTEDKRLVMPVYVDEARGWRLTFTLKTINRARSIAFMVEGKEKSTILSQVLDTSQRSLPAQLVSPENGLLQWFVDRQAAQALSQAVLSDEIAINH